VCADVCVSAEKAGLVLDERLVGISIASPLHLAYCLA